MKKIFLALFTILILWQFPALAEPQDELKPVLEKALGNLNNSLAGLEESLSSAAAKLSKTGMNGPQTRDILRALCAVNPNIIDCAIIDPAGVLVIIEPQDYKKYEGASVNDQAQIQKIRAQKKPVLSNLFVPVEGGRAVAFEYPVISPDGLFLGAISMLLRIDGILSAAVSPGIKGTACMIWAMQTDGLIIYDPDPNQINKNIFTDDLFKPFDALIAFAGQVAGKRSGSGSYEFYAKGLSNEARVRKDAVWNTFACHSAEWRLIAVKITNYTAQDVIIKREVQTAVSMLEAVYAKVTGKELTLDQAKKMGADLLRDLRYGDDKEGYFFADTVEGVNVVLYGRKDVEGINRYNANIHGVYYVKEFIKKGKQGGGYTDYWFPRKDGKDPLRKRSYNLMFAPFGWVIGTGYYLEEETGPKREN